MGAGVWRAAQATAKGLEPLRQCSQPGSLNPGLDARIGWYGQTTKHLQAPSQKMSHTRLIKAQTKMVWWPGSGSLTWPDANDAPPVYRVGLTRPVANAEHGKAAAVSRPGISGQANRKASPGEAALRGSNKPRPVCNGSDMPTSIWSLLARESAESSLGGKANDD